MDHQMTVHLHLTDDEYTALTTEAKQSGQEPEEIIQDLLDDVIDRLHARLLPPSKSGHILSRKETGYEP